LNPGAPVDAHIHTQGQQAQAQVAVGSIVFIVYQLGPAPGPNTFGRVSRQLTRPAPLDANRGARDASDWRARL